jgi:UDP:flavonoid glycosyltransferase YjiC (YdhE family)
VHGVDVTYQADEVVRELVEPLARKLGLTEPDVLGDVTVDPCPPSMQTPTGLRHLPVRYVPYNGRAVVPSWLWQPPQRPRICITWGTSTTKLTGLRTFLPPKIIEAARRFGWELVVSLAPNDVAALGPVPEEVRVVESLALHLLLPSCTAVIHQGGNGTILTAAHNGLPQVTLPQLPDQTFHCDRFAQTGAGLVLRPGEATEDAVAAALETVVRDPSYRAAAGLLRDEMLAQPTPAQLVPDLEALASVGSGSGLSEVEASR